MAEHRTRYLRQQKLYVHTKANFMASHLHIPVCDVMLSIVEI